MRPLLRSLLAVLASALAVGIVTVPITWPAPMDAATSPAVDGAACSWCCLQYQAVCATPTAPLRDAYDNGTGPCPQGS